MSSSDINHRPVRSWTKLTIETAKPLSDIVAAFLSSISSSGIEFQSDFSPELIKQTEIITIYLDEQSPVKQRVAEIHLFLTDLRKSYPIYNTAILKSEIIMEEDWGNSWKKHFKPVEVTKHLLIKPSWESCNPRQNQFVIEMDPGMAFGTGLHASTQLSLRLIDALYHQEAPGPLSTLDVGTGTGILGMSCALLGCQSVIGIDNDIDARVAAENNIQRNKLLNDMSIIDVDLAEIEGRFELVIANIIHNTLIEISKTLTARVAEHGYLILAGILTGQQLDNINKTYCALDLKIIRVEHQDEWSATCLQKI